MEVVNTAPQTLAGVRALLTWAAHFKNEFDFEMQDAYLASLLNSPILAA